MLEVLACTTLKKDSVDPPIDFIALIQGGGRRGKGGGESESEKEVWVLGVRQVKMIKCTNSSQIHNKLLP